MKYRSTRGGVAGVSFADGIRGYAADGGLFVPETVPAVSPALLREWSELPFQRLAQAVLRLFIAEEEMPEADLEAVVQASFSEFSDPSIVPVRDVGGLLFVELFHGPTLSFKDFGQQMLCKCLDYFSRRTPERQVTVVVSTTGDTGPAAIHGLLGSAACRIFVSYPVGQVSRLQELQMTTVRAPNVTVIQFEGGGDDMDQPIKALSLDADLRARGVELCSLNSINVGRVVAQTVHYFWTYFQVVRLRGLALGDPVVFAVPTGAMGNVAAGCLAKRMGLPAAHFICGVNANDIVHRAVADGRFHKLPMQRTVSEAMNAQVPYNFERVLYYAVAEGDTALMQEFMRQVDTQAALTLEGEHLERLRRWIRSAAVSDEATLAFMRRFWQDHQYLADPHTSVGGAAAELNPAGGPPIAVLSTAHPAKFEEAIRRSLGDAFWTDTMPSLLPARARALYDLPEVPPERFREGEDWQARLRTLLLQSPQS